MMSDEQFNTLMNTLSHKQEDHDLLVEINTVVRLNHNTYQADKLAQAEKIALLESRAGSAHRRIDYIFTGVLVSVGGLVISALAFFFTHL